MKKIASLLSALLLTSFVVGAQNTSLFGLIEEANASLPEMIDDGMELTSFSVENNAVMVNITLEEQLYMAFVQSLESRPAQLTVCFGFLRNLEKDEDPDSRALFNIIMDKQYGFGCSFTSADGTQYFPVVVGPEEIRQGLYSFDPVSTQLKQTVETVKASLPIVVGSCVLSDISYDGHVMTYTMEADDDSIGMKEFFATADEEAIKNLMVKNFVTESSYPLLALLVQAESSFRMDIVNTTSGKTLSALISPEEIEEALEKGAMDPSERLDALLDRTNELLPVEIGEGISFVSAARRGNIVYYLYRIAGKDSSKMVKQIKKNSEEYLIAMCSDLVESEDVTIDTLLKLLVETDCTLVYAYQSEDRKKSTVLPMPPSLLEKLIGLRAQNRQ